VKKEMFIILGSLSPISQKNLGSFREKKGEKEREKERKKRGLLFEPTKFCYVD